MILFDKLNALTSFCSQKFHYLKSILTKTPGRDRAPHGPKEDYFIEIRLIDRKIKAEMKSLEDSLSKQYRIGQVHYVPHISLVGGFKSSDKKRLETDFLKICSETPAMKFSISGWDTFSGRNNVAFFKINPSPELRKFRWRLAQTFLSYCDGFTPFDSQSEEEFVFHGTIALHIPGGKFSKALSFIQSHFPDQINGEYYVDRVTILKNRLIFSEYDFFLREKLDRTQARTAKVYRFSEEVKTDYIDGKEDVIKIDSSDHRVFLISDSHFDHENIIRYVKRPFSNSRSMNNAMVRIWNSAVSRTDTVLFLGDLTYGRGNKGIPFWLSQLSGNILFIKGSHDRIEDLPHFHKITRLILAKHPDVQFILVHDPKDIGSQYQDFWKIHGHLHNNNTEKFPFINGEKKTINVSVELLDYTPLDIEKLFDLNFTKIRYMKDIHSEPEYFP